MKIWLSSHDGRVHFPCEASGVEEAFEKFAESLGYESFAAFSVDTGYRYCDITATRIVDERKSPAWDSVKMMGDYIKREEQSVIRSAYRWLLGNRA